MTDGFGQKQIKNQLTDYLTNIGFKFSGVKILLEFLIKFIH